LTWESVVAETKHKNLCPYFSDVKIFFFESKSDLFWREVLRALAAGLPDGFFSNQKSQIGKILEGPRLENVVIFYGHLEHFTDIWDI
jgi:hypothetical protein